MTTATKTLRTLARDVTCEAELRDMTAQEQAEEAEEERATRARSDRVYSDPGRTFWTVTLTYRRRKMRTPFHQGSGVEREPDAARVLDCILSDASSYESARTFEEWAADLGFDPDSRRAERIYRAVQKQTENVQHLLGEHYRMFLEAERD